MSEKWSKSQEMELDNLCTNLTPEETDELWELARKSIELAIKIAKRKIKELTEI